MRLLNKIHIFLLMLMVTILSACSSSEAPETIDVTKLGEPVSMYISVPTDTTNSGKTRVGDPGSDAQVQQAWDKLVIIVAYKDKATTMNDYDAEPKRMVYWDIFKKEDFDKNERIEHAMSILDAPEGNNGTRAITMYLPVGTVNVYGVTYSDDCGFNLEDSLKKIKEDGKNASEIEALQISNDYAQDQKNELAKFLSVATGFGVDTKKSSSRDLLISKGSSEIEMKQYWAMYLTRLATKLDIQWDAKGAYDKKDDQGNLVYTDVKVSDFTYNGGATNLAENEKSGYGRLFPSLQTATATAIGGSKTFVNTSEISKRNGRQYHYFFPDGSKTPSITFSLTTQKEGESTEEKKDYTFKFDESNVLPLQQGAWYKINATIKGQSSANTTITIGNSSN